MQIYCTPKICPLPSRIILEESKTKNKVNDILQCGAEYYNKNEKSLFGKGRYRPIVEARQSIMYALRSFTGLGLLEIGVLFNRDHTTVIHSCRKVIDLQQSDENFRYVYEGFVLELKGRGIIN